MKVLNILYDKRSECLSLITVMPLSEYKKITFDSFELSGNIEGQRNVIRKSTVASKIRKRMNDDFIAGAVFPNVVIGVLLDSMEIDKIKKDKSYFESFNVPSGSVSIIDGMQRSNIYFNNYTGNERREIRVEFWVSDKTVKMLYRMLVLNTGQVPWNTRRQIEVIFSSLSNNIIDSMIRKNPDLKDKVEIVGVDDNKRRTQPGRFMKSTMIELYLGYNTRKVKIDVNDILAEEFQRFDVMESIEKDINFDLFVDAFSALCKLDFAFSQCDDKFDNGQYKEGKDIFSSLPACIGFIVACSEYVLGKLSVEREESVKSNRNESLVNQVDKNNA